MPEIHQTHPTLFGMPEGTYWACAKPGRAYEQGKTCFYPPCYYCMVVAHETLTSNPDVVLKDMESFNDMPMRALFDLAVEQFGYDFPPLPAVT